MKTKTQKVEIESIVIKMLDDDCPDTSHLGKYTDNAEPGVIVCRENEYLDQLGDDYELPEKGNEYRFFKPVAGDEKVGTDDYYKYGMQDYKRMKGLNDGSWSYIGIEAAATVKYPTGNNSYRLETLSSSGLWGIESDCDDYLQEVMKEQIDELREHLMTFNVSLENFDTLAQEAIEKAS